MTSPAPSSEKPLARNSDKLAACLIFIAATIWLWYSATHELVQDEAYYWQWSRHLAVGYFDNTPVMAWLIDSMTHIFGNNELGVRSSAVFSSCISSWFLYKLAKQLFGDTVGLASLGLALIIPLFSAGAFLMTADTPQMAFWSITAYVTWQAINSEPKSKQAWGKWLLAGVLAGLAAMSKVNGLFVLVSVLLFLAIEPTQRKWLTKSQPYLAALIALIVFSPFIWWNQTHGNAFWLHIHHMSSRGSDHFTLKFVGDYLGGQAVLISPLLFLTFLYALATTLRSKSVSPGLRYVWSLTAIVFLETLAVSFKSKVEANWAVTAYVGGIILLAQFIVRTWQNRTNRIWHIASITLAVVISFASYESTITSSPPRLAILDKFTNQLYGWQTMADRVESERRAMAGNPFIFGVNYQMPSELAFYMPGKPTTYCLVLHNKGNEYEYWTNASSLAGRDAIMAADIDKPDDIAVLESNLLQVFRRVQIEPELKIYRPGISGPIRIIQILRCYSFKGYKREQWQDGY